MGQRAQSAEEYVALVDQAIFELEELLATREYDPDAIEGGSVFLDRLLGEVRELRAGMADGSYLFGRRDLPFMRLVKQASADQLPFIRLFYRINATHRLGLDVRDD